MSLLSDSMTSCIVMVPTNTLDGYGGTSVVWQDGSVFQASFVKNSSTEIEVADKKDVKAIYTITTSRDVTLVYHDIIKRVSDNKLFRVISDSVDAETPISASLNMKQVTAEEWEEPTNGNNHI